MSGILSGKMEKISKDIFKNHSRDIIEIIGNSHGVYSLYDNNELYYVGKATDLKRRVKHHLKDRHGGAWNYFSIYLIKNEKHINDLESLLISISKPKGNKNIPKAKIKNQLKKALAQKVREKQKQELIDLGLEKKSIKNQRKNKKSQTRISLKNYFSSSKPLIKTYKGKELKATLLKSGKIRFKGKTYDSLSTAAKKATGRSAINGWKFWFIQDDNGNWVKLANL